MKKLLAILIVLLLFSSPAFSAPEQTTPVQKQNAPAQTTPGKTAPAKTPPAKAVPDKPVLSEIPAWPAKTSWLGQQVAFYPAKLNATASYLLVFLQPGEDMSGTDQLFLARKLIGQKLTVKSLHQLTKKGAATKYYWQLVGSDGVFVWVKDNPDGPLSSLPFALNSEVAAENEAIAEINALVGSTIWVNRNFVRAPELSAPVGHLVPLTVAAFKSSGPFSDTYSLALRKDDGTPVVWTIAPTGNRAAFSNGQFYGMIRSGFLHRPPETLFPHWSQTDWQLIKAQEIRVGWDREKVLMSWGEPPNPPTFMAVGPEEGAYEWRYGKYHLYFRKDQLMKIKIPDPAFADKKPAAKTAAGDKPAPGDKPAVKAGAKKGQQPEPPMLEIPGAKKQEDKQANKQENK